MLKDLRNFKESLLFAVCLLVSGYSNASNGDDVPRIILALGRLHPLILHLPIGALLLTFFLDIVGRIRKNYPKQIIKYALGFSSLFSIMACVFGYFLSLEDGYSGKTLDIHFWTGILSATLITLLFLLCDKENKQLKRLFFPLFVGTIVSISVAGHYGSVLTRGDNFLTEYIKAPPKLQTIEHIDSLNMYDNVVLKIFDDKCTQCHNTTKRKGDLALISKESLLEGGESGDVISLGNSRESLLYKHIMLPISDEDHMPPEGKPQLTKDELWLIKYWLDNSGEVDNKVVAIAKNDTLNKLLKKYLVFEEKHIEEAALGAIQDVEDEGFLVRKLVPTEPELWVKYNNKVIAKEAVKTLVDLKDQIVELDLSNTSLTDDMTSGLRKLKNLEKLELNNTQITDKALKHLKHLKALKILNLVGNDISEQGLENLLTSITPEHVYAWKTKIDQRLAQKLSNDFDVKINSGVTGFVETTQLKVPFMVTKKALFVDTISIKLDSKLRNTKIFYTLNGDEPDTTALQYTKPIMLDTNATIAVKAFKKGWNPSETLKRDFYKVNHKVSDYTITHQPEKQYPGSDKLFDLELGTLNFKDDKWTGFLGNDINTVIDLGAVKPVTKIAVDCLGQPKQWILFPTAVEVYASNNKASGFKRIGTMKTNKDNTNDMPLIERFFVEIPKTEARYYKVVVKNPKVLPKGHEGEGNASWIFVSEIMFW
ncbi:FN3 associated domain-containing protein [Snuella sedimenti]|uniref:Chitobiase/beta-hexosaminidase C-terminal domain-containing protein n=1 Tax=Snuella sedimenti TaxID=2798802 RepID=A0A8J7IMQ6_9FLAO|nr:FN3 associated domain-containing protein [Snuella sedimenti]MBJ6367422.1 chitobiase/beta-hexosaminidase C-terminal domain-containing protein [Snuella sedimenti]